MIELEIIKELQNNALKNCVIEAENSMKYENISLAHAKALLNNKKVVYGYLCGGFVLIAKIEDLNQFTNFYIE